MVPALVLKPQDNESKIVLRGIGTEVAETHIQRQEGPLFGPTRFDDPSIVAPPESLVPNGDGIVALLLEDPGDYWVQVLVGLESHHEVPSRTTRSLASSAA